MDWDKLRIFHAVADAGSLTHAGDTLRLSQSAVSRQVRALEESLNTTLFHRHARGLILTEQGELLFDATSAMNKRLDTAAARIRDSEEEVFGELRVTTTPQGHHFFASSSYSKSLRNISSFPQQLFQLIRPAVRS